MAWGDRCSTHTNYTQVSADINWLWLWGLWGNRDTPSPTPAPTTCYGTCDAVDALEAEITLLKAEVAKISTLTHVGTDDSTKPFECGNCQQPLLPTDSDGVNAVAKYVTPGLVAEWWTGEMSSTVCDSLPSTRATSTACFQCFFQKVNSTGVYVHPYVVGNIRPADTDAGWELSVDLAVTTDAQQGYPQCPFELTGLRKEFRLQEYPCNLDGYTAVWQDCGRVRIVKDNFGVDQVWTSTIPTDN